MSIVRRRLPATLGLRHLPLLALLFVATVVGIAGLKLAALAVFGDGSGEPDTRLFLAKLAVSLSGASLALFTAVYWQTTELRRWALALSGAALVSSAAALWFFDAPPAPAPDAALLADGG